jgi:IS4 transposase
LKTSKDAAIVLAADLNVAKTRRSRTFRFRRNGCVAPAGSSDEWGPPQGFEAPLRRIRFKDPETDKPLVFLTNNFALPALTITKLYHMRWQIELFFKWIKQHVRIKAFLVTTENAMKSQIWIAVSAYVIVAIIKKRLEFPASLSRDLEPNDV